MEFLDDINSKITPEYDYNSNEENDNSNNQSIDRSNSNDDYDTNSPPLTSILKIATSDPDPEPEPEPILPPPDKAIPFVIFRNNEFIIPEEAKILLSQDTYQNIGIISLVGKYRTGKSFLLNRVLLNRTQSEGFGVGPTIKPCTKGIWIWSSPLMIQNSYCKEPFPCFLIDTEGLEAYDEEVNHDSKIFLIAILISSLFIFNSFGAIDENAINSLSFVLNLSKTIKLHNNSTAFDNENQLAEYFPTLLWLLRDFHLKLEDMQGNVITEKQYLEYALREVKGSSNKVEEKNKIRNLIKNYFPERDCYTMVRPVEKESDLQKLQSLSDNQLRKEFVEQAKIFRNKVMKKTKPKIFMKKNMTGSMLLELVQSILNAINGGSIPVIENSWKYVIENECIKNSENTIKKFIDELYKFKEENCGKSDYVSNIKYKCKEIYNKYLNEFKNNGVFDDDENKKIFTEKLKSKMDIEMGKFEKENEKIFEDKFNEEIDKKLKNFVDGFSSGNNSIYNKNYHQFFDDLEVFKNESEKLTPDFPAKQEILFDKVLILIRKFIDYFFVKAKLQNEKQIANYKNIIDNLQERLKKLNEELISKNNSSTETINKLNKIINNEKLKHKEYEKNITNIKNSNKNEKDSYEEKIKKLNKDNADKIQSLQNEKNNIEELLHNLEEEILKLKKTNEKNNSILEQKVATLENENKNLKEINDKLSKDINNSELLYKEKLSSLEKQNEILTSNSKKNDDISNNVLNQNMNSIMSFIKENLNSQKEETKNFYNKILSNQQEKESNVFKDKELLFSFQEITQKNQNLALALAALENKNKQNEEQIAKLNLFQDIVNSSSGFKCKYCSKLFSLDIFKSHLINCQQKYQKYGGELHNTPNKNEIMIDKLKMKILKGRVKQDELGKPYLEYIIDIWYNGQNWRINKRFNQFANLYKTLKNYFKGKINMPDSSNIFINLNGFGQTSSFHENKILQLEKFIKDLAEIDMVVKSKYFKKFLEFDKFFEDNEENETEDFEDNDNINQIENARYNNNVNSSINVYKVQSHDSGRGSNNYNINNYNSYNYNYKNKGSGGSGGSDVGKNKYGYNYTSKNEDMFNDLNMEEYEGENNNFNNFRISDKEFYLNDNNTNNMNIYDYDDKE